MDKLEFRKFRKRDLETCFRNLKKVIRMLDETISDKEVGEGF